jgi:hypothetical protein
VRSSPQALPAARSKMKEKREIKLNMVQVKKPKVF